MRSTESAWGPFGADPAQYDRLFAPSLYLVEEARAVIARLDRIEAMERAREPGELVLDQLALLAVEAERWLETEHTAGIAARKALERCLDALERAPTPERLLAGVPGYADQGEEAFDSLRMV
jgi:hypothetical protein